MKVSHNVSLKNYTTFRIGGLAKYFVIADTIDELVDAIRWSVTKGLNFFILGAGSNILVDDNGYTGLVIKLGTDFREIIFNEKRGIVTIGAAVVLPEFVAAATNRGWSNYEYLSGIPGTMGGAVRINAGTRYGEIKDNFTETQVLTRALERKTMSLADMQFSYRNSKITKTNAIILSATFALQRKDDVPQIRAKIIKILEDRRRRQPSNPRNCGSVFISKPDMMPPAWYIEQAGLKGFRIGDAMVSYEHANWIVNLGSARARDVKMIIDYLQSEVYKKFNTILVREVIYIPDDTE